MDVAGQLRKGIREALASGEAEMAIGIGCPGPALQETADCGEVWLSGRVLICDEPLWYCKNCGDNR